MALKEYIERVPLDEEFEVFEQDNVPASKNGSKNSNRITVRLQETVITRRKLSRVPANHQEAEAMFRRATSNLKDEEEEYGKEKTKELDKEIHTRTNRSDNIGGKFPTHGILINNLMHCRRSHRA